MIRAMMAEFQLEGFASKSEAAELMPETNSKDRYLPDELADVFDGIADGLRIAGAIRKKNAVGLQGEDILGGSLRGHNPYVAVVIHEQSQNVLLDAVIERRDAM